MFTIPDLLMPREFQARIREAREREAARRMKLAVPWSLSVRWEPELQFKAETYEVMRLWDVRACDVVWKAGPDQIEKSPDGQFAYIHKTLPAGETLPTVSGKRRGSVLFDGPVTVPCLYEWDDRSERWGGYDAAPWIGLTPMEMLSLRPGTRRAKGRVVVAGLGIGHHLVEVSKRRQVSELVLVERSRELVDWLLPRVKPHLGRRLDDVIVGDAYEELPKLKADVALVDIFPRYGCNDIERDRLREACPNIRYLWAWGSNGV